MVCLFLAFLTCLIPEKKVFETTGENMTTFEYDADQNGYYAEDTVILTPGVYQVRAYAQVPPEQAITFQVNADDSTFHALLGNAVTMFAGQTYVDFEIYVLNTIDSAYFSTIFSKDITPSALQSLSLYRTNYGGRMACCLVITVSIILNFMLSYREKVRQGKVTKARQIAFWVMLLSVALAYFPYFTDYMTMGADTGFHLLRIEGLKETLRIGGQFPVRMQSYWLADHGYPVSVFYGDLFLYIPALMRLIGFPLMTSYKTFLFMVFAAMAAIAFFSFEKCTKNTYAALFGSMIYVLAPYGIYNATNRGAIGELLGMTFLPLVCCGFYLLYTMPQDSPDYSRAKYPLIFGLSGILQSHFLTTEITVVFLALLAVIFAKRTFRKRTIQQLVQAAALFLAINAFFWVPFLIMLNKDQYVFNNLVNLSIQSRGIYFAEFFQLFLYMGGVQTAMYNTEPIQLGGALFVLLLGFLLMICFKYFSSRKGNNVHEKKTIILWIMTMMVVFMGTRYFPWEFLSHIPGVHYLVTALQFSTSFFSLASVLGAFFAAFFCLWLTQEALDPMVIKGSLLFVAIIAIFSTAFHVNDIAYEKEPIRLYSGENLGYGISSSSDDASAADAPFIAAQNGTHEDMRIVIPAKWKGNIRIRFEGFLIFRVAELISLITILGLVVRKAAALGWHGGKNGTN
jgi:hypothetical protein